MDIPWLEQGAARAQRMRVTTLPHRTMKRYLNIVDITRHNLSGLCLAIWWDGRLTGCINLFLAACSAFYLTLRSVSA